MTDCDTKRKPEYFMLGAPKCGTTALANYLASHPMIQVSKPKEPNYFCKEFNLNNLSTVNKVRIIKVISDQQYLDLYFPNLDDSNALVALDASVWYLYSKVAVREILKFQPEAKFLVMIRNPVDMAYSLHSMMNFGGKEPESDFIRAWELSAVRNEEHVIQNAIIDIRLLNYKMACCLGTQLQRLFSHVNRQNVHIELQEDFKRDPRSVYLRTLDFMGVDDDGRNEFLSINAGRKINNQILISILRSKLVMSAVGAVKKTLRIKTLGFGRPELPMPIKTRKFLIHEFNYEISLLESILDRDLSTWRMSS